MSAARLALRSGSLAVRRPRSWCIVRFCSQAALFPERELRGLFPRSGFPLNLRQSLIFNPGLFLPLTIALRRGRPGGFREDSMQRYGIALFQKLALILGTAAALAAV